MRKKQRDVKPRHEVEEKDSGDERVLGRDQVENEQANAGNGLAKTEPMLPQQFVLPKIIFRTAPGQRLQTHSENNQAAVNAVALPGQFRAGRIKSHHDPDAEPEERCDHHDLAEQQKAVETFCALRNHGYCDPIGVRVRDGGQPSTRAKVVANMIPRLTGARRRLSTSYSHTMAIFVS